MKVGMIEVPGILKIIESDEPKIEHEDDVLLRVKRVGICGSDMHIFHGSNPFAVYPRVWGHEFVGEVVDAGNAVTRAQKGDRVAGEPIRSCGTCYACKKGRPNVCASLQVMGVHIDGGCREKLVMPEKYIHKLPDGISWEEAALVEPFTIGAQTCLRANVKEGDIVLVYGVGTIGLTAVQMAKLYGATVIALDIVDAKLNYAAETGADYTINARSCDVYDRVMEITEGMGPNVTIDAVCVKSSFEDAVTMTSVAGRVVELGFGESPSEIRPLALTKKELTICGSRLQTGRFPVVIDFIRQGKLKLKGFVTSTYPLEKMREAFKYMEEKSAVTRKILISMD
ncbi:MAG: zinc-binding alcohol dehydrogenase family protein [Synergistaceae bacterium]|jgi:L-gulonate 5-dehydrogenase|nr:zinc-binding alcohol dehydrogenase family protein [Synergistaceae bacterium]